MNETAPETAPRAAETGERLSGAAWLEDVKTRWLRPCGYCDAGLSVECTHPDADYRPVMLRLVENIERLSRRLAERFVETERLRADAEAVLRDAGWVDPEEAARLRSDYWRVREDRSRFMGERDALLPVAELARQVADVMRNVAYAGPVGSQLRHDFLTAIDALDSGTKP